MKPQTSGLVVGKLKRKVLREPVGVTLNGKIQGFRGNAVEFGQVCIEHDLLAAFSRIATSFAKSGPRNLKSTANISAFMSPTFARRLKAILQAQVSSRPSRESGIASSPMKRSK